jgi:hypothetical protein
MDTVACLIPMSENLYHTTVTCLCGHTVDVDLDVDGDMGEQEAEIRSAPCCHCEQEQCDSDLAEYEAQQEDAST